MKKKIVLITAFALCASILTGCSGDTESEKSSDNDRVASENEKPEKVTENKDSSDDVTESDSENSDSNPIEASEYYDSSLPFIESSFLKDYELKIDVKNDGISLGNYLGSETDIVFPENLRVVELKQTFRKMPNIKSVKLNDHILRIDSAFYENVFTFIPPEELPKSLQYIGGDWFESGVYNPYKSDEEFTIIGDSLLVNYSGNAETVVIPDNVKYMAQFWYGENYNIKRVEIPSSVVTLDGVNFPNDAEVIWANAVPEEEPDSSDDDIYDNGEEEFFIRDGVLLGYHGEGGDVTIPDEVTAIDKNAFSDFFNNSSNHITTLTIPSRIKEVFLDISIYLDSQLDKIVLEEGVETFGNVPECVKELVVPSTLRQIGYIPAHIWDDLVSNHPAALTNDYDSVDEKDWFTIIGDGILMKYNGPRNVETLTVPEGVKSMHNFERPGTGSGIRVSTLVIPDSVVNISSLGDIFEIGSVTIPDSVTADNIGLDACINNLILPSNWTTIPRDLFFETRTPCLVIPEGVKTIEGSAFRSPYLEVIVLPESLELVKEQAIDLTIQPHIVVKSENTVFEGSNKGSRPTFPTYCTFTYKGNNYADFFAFLEARYSD